MPDLVIQADNLGKKYTIGHRAENGRYTALIFPLYEFSEDSCGSPHRHP